MRAALLLPPSEHRTLLLYARHGRVQAVADELREPLKTTTDRLYRARHRLGVPTTMHALHALGWLRVPETVR